MVSWRCCLCLILVSVVIDLSDCGLVIHSKSCCLCWRDCWNTYITCNNNTFHVQCFNEVRYCEVDKKFIIFRWFKLQIKMKWPWRCQWKKILATFRLLGLQVWSCMKSCNKLSGTLKTMKLGSITAHFCRSELELKEIKLQFTKDANIWLEVTLVV